MWNYPTATVQPEPSILFGLANIGIMIGMDTPRKRPTLFALQAVVALHLPL